MSPARRRRPPALVTLAVAAIAFLWPFALRPPGVALAAPAQPIRIGLAWDRWAAQVAGRPSSGIGVAQAVWRWPAAATSAAPQTVSPAAGAYLVASAGPAVTLAATDSPALARAAWAAARGAGRGGAGGAAGGASETAGTPGLATSVIVRRAGSSWYCILDPSAAGDAATVAAAASGLAERGWPAYAVPWPRSPGSPGPGGAGVAVALDGGLAGVAFPATFPVGFTAADGSLVRHATTPYRGTLQVAKAGKLGLLAVTNRLDIEDYLLGVVPSEMPASWPVEALKAQAVAARTYAVANLGKHSSHGFDLCFDIHCQAYLGYENEYPNPSTAVRATAGVVATYGGRLINAVYHAHAGGATDSSAAVWGSATPYLAGTSRTYEKPYYWTATNSRAEVERVVAGAFPDGAPEGLFPLLAMTPTQFTAGHRAMRVDLRGAGATAQMTTSKLRSGLGSYRLKEAIFGAWGVWVASMWPGGGSAAAMAGAMEPVVTWAPGARGEGVIVSYGAGGPDAAASTALSLVDPAYFVFSGQGFGHGVGMSQWGAREMAAIGKTYREILANFYRGITISGNYGR